MIYVGTAGYSYKDWVGPFYPEKTRDSAMLEHYAEYFNFVEVNSSYYHMPGSRLFESIDKKTPESFRVAVKLFQGFTHGRDAGKTEAEKFMYAVSPLLESRKLICLLAQFPYSYHFNEQNREHLKKLRQWFDGMEINVEFRNQEWIRHETVELLKKENLGFVCVDEPRVSGLIKNVIVKTSSISYVRLHGRNAEKWYGGEGSERYDYLYTPEELVEWVSRVKELEKDSKAALVSFNNHPMGKAVQNALALKGYLK